PVELLERIFTPPALNCSRCTDLNPLHLSNLKCCHFFPHLPNYAIALALIENDTRWIKASLTQKTHVFPIGLVPDASYIKNYYRSQEPHRDLKLKCPMLENGLCSIWNYRESECAFF